ncbi:hypothetical protein KBC31_01375 [Candidatus Saccharibacteria bacterium]|jgi:hypothetical protein|nr:hypothetical protein [Candidatus Saccharibacteria bacterium]
MDQENNQNTDHNTATPNEVITPPETNINNNAPPEQPNQAPAHTQPAAESQFTTQYPQSNQPQPMRTALNQKNSKIGWIIAAIVGGLTLLMLIGGALLLVYFASIGRTQRLADEAIQKNAENIRKKEEEQALVPDKGFTSVMFMFEYGADYGNWQPTRSSEANGAKIYKLGGTDCVAQYSSGTVDGARTNKDLINQLHGGLRNQASIKDGGTEVLKFNFDTDSSNKKMPVTTNITYYTGNDGIGYKTRIGLIHGSSTSGVVHESCKSSEWSKNQTEFNNIRDKLTLSAY